MKKHENIFGGIFVGVLFIGALCVTVITPIYILYQMQSEKEVKEFKQEAVEVGAGYWCIENHKQVFSFKPCDQRQTDDETDEEN